MIELKNITKIYNPNKGNKKNALDNVSFKLPNKGLIFILGKSGSGKSTLLNILGLLDKPNDGEILINGKNATKLREKDITNYRSNHIGFIFQEFNLLDELNVYDNIDLALNLKAIKSNKEDIDGILNKVGLNGLEKRTVGELSGGEKQRVAIARALIKQPTIILADEPTGNLDESNSKVIFNILKSISKDHLVVVVSHDIESANTFADGIIEIKDGKKESDTVTSWASEENQVLEFKKSHIKFLKRLKLSFGFLQKKKIRLLFTSIIISIAFALFGFSMSLFYFDIPKMHAETMKYENESIVTISKYRNHLRGNSLFTKDIDAIVGKINSKYILASDIKDVEEIEFNFGSISEHEGAAYYNITYDKAKFLTYSDDDLSELDLIGNIPTKEREILISEILADYIVENGAYSFEQNNYMNQKELKVKTKEELIGKSIYINREYFYISGIIKDPNLRKYESLKNESIDKMAYEPSDLYKEFESVYRKNIQEFVINKNFFDVTNLEPDNEISQDMYKIAVVYNKEKYFGMSFANVLNIEIEYFDGNRLVKTSKVNTGEVIISTTTLSSLYADDYNKIFMEELLYKKNHELEYNEEDFKKNIVTKFLKKHNVIGDTITFEITDDFEYTDNPKVNQIDLKIIGIDLDNYTDYFGTDLVTYLVPRNLVKNIQILESNETKLEKLFRDFSDSDKYNVETRFSNKINSIESVINSIEKIAKYIALGFMVFAIIILTLFITNSTSINGKKIGILRALGAKVKDIIRIFLFEGLIIGVVTFVLANILTIIGIHYTNLFITKEMYFYVRPLVFDLKIVLLISLVVLLTIIISLIIPIIKLAKTKPITLINRK